MSIDMKGNDMDLPGPLNLTACDDFFEALEDGDLDC